MFSQTAEYALRAVAFVAAHAPNACTTEQISQGTKVPAAYLSKVIQALGRGGVLLSRRGIGGGITLARGVEEVTILDVINAVEPVKRITHCPLGLAAHGVRLCPLHRRLDDALAQMEKAFGDTTLADLLADRDPARRPQCKFPRGK